MNTKHLYSVMCPNVVKVFPNGDRFHSDLICYDGDAPAVYTSKKRADDWALVMKTAHPYNDYYVKRFRQGLGL